MPNENTKTYAIKGISIQDLAKIAEKLGETEERVIHMAISRMYADLFFKDQEYDFPTDEQIAEHRDRMGPFDPAHTRTLLDLLTEK